MRYCDLTLIDLTYETDKIGNQIKKETLSCVFAEEKSVQSNEFFKAAAIDLKASKMFEIYSADYCKQRQAEDEEGNRYDIYRTFVKGDKIELYCSETKK